MNLNKNNLHHNFKRLLQRFTLFLYKSLNQNDDPKHGEFEYECNTICKTLIKNPKTKLLISPISKKRYINNHDKQIFIILEHRLLTIVNHNHSYSIDLTLKSYERIASLFDNEVERKRQEMEEEIRSNVKHSLSNIFENIKNESL